MIATDKKRRKTESKQETEPVDSSQTQQPNLERRAAYFARADPKSLPSSTPTGLFNEKAKGEKDHKESWPGPFATAHAMIQQREDARKAREDAILAAASGAVTASVNLADMDEFDKFLNLLKWEPEGRSGAKRHLIPHLSDLCVKLLVPHFHEIDDSTLGVLSTEICTKFAIELCRQRMFTCEAALQLAVTGSEGIFFPECSNLSDEALVAAMEKVSRFQSEEDPIDTALGEKEDSHLGKISSLRLLQLRNCGHGFTDQVAETLSEKHARGLLMLELTGCYRLNEAALCCLLLQCRINLKSLDLSCNSRLGVNSLSMIATMSALTYLKLDHATPLTNDMIAPLAAPGSALDSLEHLSLAGLINLSDDGFSSIIVKFGPKLRSLCVRGCIGLTDDSIILMRESCRVLDALDIGGIGAITAAALLGLFIEGPVQNGGIIVEIPILFDNTIDASEQQQISSADSTEEGGADTSMCSSIIGRLSKISLAGLPSSVTDDVVIQLCRLSGSLKSVDIGGCSSLTSRAISALQLLSRDSLQDLDVSFVRNFTENSLGALVDHAPQLRNLSVWGCTQLTKRFFDGHRNDTLSIQGRMEA